ncbi:unnamed protein product [Jaminaea pallidilutea]
MAAALPVPEEVLQQILSHLEPLDLYRASRANKAWRSVATGASLWEQHFYAFWRSDLKDAEADWRTWRRREKMRAWAGEERKRQSSQETGADPSSSSLDGLVNLEGNLLSRCGTLPSARPFYWLFIDRMNADEALMSAAHRHLDLKSGHLHSAYDMIRRYGDGARDLLQALTWDQSIDADNIVEARSLPGDSQQACNSFPKAYEIHARTAQGQRRKPCRQYCVALLDWSKAMLGFLNRRQALSTFRDLKDHEMAIFSGGFHEDLPERQHVRMKIVSACQDVEDGIASMTLFRGGSLPDLLEYLDVLALYVHLELQHLQSGEGADSSKPPMSTTRQVVQSVFDILHDLGFDIADPLRFLDLDNSLLDVSTICPHNRQTLPLTLTVIVTGVLRRLGIASCLCNTPGRIVAVAMEDSSATSEAEEPDRFFIDASTPSKVVREANEVIGWVKTIRRQWPVMMANPDDESDSVGLWSEELEPAKATEILCRSARNILNAVQNGSQRLPRVVRVNAEEPSRTRRRQSQTTSDVDSDHDDQYDSSAVETRSSGRPHKPNLSPRRLLGKYLRRHPAQRAPLPLGHPSPTSSRCCLDPLRPATVQLLPTERAIQRSTVAEEEDSLYTAAWLLTELDELQFGSRGKEWIVSLMENTYPVDVLLFDDGKSGLRFGGNDDGEDLADDFKPTSIFRGVGIRPSSAEDGRNDGHGNDRIFHSFLVSSWSSDRAKVPVKTRSTGKSPFSHITSSDKTSTSREDASEDVVQYGIGSLFSHRRYGYRGVIVGWDAQCDASPEWMRQMQVDSLPAGGRHQPFYNVIVDDGSSRYVAQCNIRMDETQPGAQAEATDQESEHVDVGTTPADTMRSVMAPYAKLLGIRGLGKHFRTIDVIEGVKEDGRPIRLPKLVKTEWMAERWPHD